MECSELPLVITADIIGMNLVADEEGSMTEIDPMASHTKSLH